MFKCILYSPTTLWLLGTIFIHPPIPDSIGDHQLTYWLRVNRLTSSNHARWNPAKKTKVDVENTASHGVFHPENDQRIRGFSHGSFHCQLEGETRNLTIYSLGITADCGGLGWWNPQSGQTPIAPQLIWYQLYPCPCSIETRRHLCKTL